MSNQTLLARIQNPLFAIELGTQLGAEMHETWRAGFFKDKGAGATRPKATKYGATWGVAHAGKPYVTVDGGVTKVDIAAVGLTDLPPDWAGENQKAGIAGVAAAVDWLLQGRSLSEPEARVYVAVEQHAQWTARKFASFGTTSSEGLGDYDKGQAALCVPYGDLSVEEQAKDLANADVAIKAVIDTLGTDKL